MLGLVDYSRYGVRFIETIDSTRYVLNLEIEINESNEIAVLTDSSELSYFLRAISMIVPVEIYIIFPESHDSKQPRSMS